MKKAILILFVLFTTSLLAQEEWGNVSKNKVSMKEIGPIWPGCEKGSESERKNCFNQKLTQHISKNFKYPAEAYKKNEQGIVVVEFVINDKGLVEIQKVTGGTESLQAEAKRNILAMPKMSKPGMLAGKPQPIKYTVPFNFKTGK